MTLRKNNKTQGLKWIWEERPQNPQAASELVSRLRLNSLLARVLAARGLHDPDEVNSFFHSNLASLTDPMLLEDMDKAAERLARAIKNKEKICVYGDYDVDGITATVLLIRFLRWLGNEVEYFIPNRISDGYGLKRSAVERIASRGTNLLITVDNGISSVNEVAHANALGLDVIITDHHQPGPVLPPACAVVNPNRTDTTLTHTPLAGVGVAFKLIHAVKRHLDIDQTAAGEFIKSLLDLVALGTVADIVPLTGENRTFVKQGIQRLQNTDKVGLKSLLDLVCGTDVRITPNSISYYIAPRLNAAGRHDQATLCVELLLTNDREYAIELTRQINRLNEERRKIESEILESCLNFIDQKIDLENQNIIIVQGEGWHVGVVGIVASRLLERFYKPSIVLVIERDIARGSGRSILGFDLYQALYSCRDLLTEYGGHKLAAGLTLRSKDIPRFCEAINQYASTAMDRDVCCPRIIIDTEVTSDELTIENVTALSDLEPYGTSNPAPVFIMRAVSLLEPHRTVGKNHLKLLLCKDGLAFPGIGFSLAECYPELTDITRTFDIAFTPIINEWRGNRNVELEIKDIKF
jgi:single-stranded-DNA-specific exonuclease